MGGIRRRRRAYAAVNRPEAADPGRLHTIRPASSRTSQGSAGRRERAERLTCRQEPGGTRVSCDCRLGHYQRQSMCIEHINTLCSHTYRATPPPPTSRHGSRQTPRAESGWGGNRLKLLHGDKRPTFRRLRACVQRRRRPWSLAFDRVHGRDGPGGDGQIVCGSVCLGGGGSWESKVLVAMKKC